MEAKIWEMIHRKEKKKKKITFHISPDSSQYYDFDLNVTNFAK